MRDAKMFKTSKAAFTLIEILVVLGIIGILASILVPVAWKIFGYARDAQCVANMKTWGQAVHIHATGHNGALPDVAGSGDPLYAASGSLKGFFEQNRMSPKIAYSPASPIFQNSAAADQWMTVNLKCYGPPDYGNAVIVDDSQVIGGVPPVPAAAFVDNDYNEVVQNGYYGDADVAGTGWTSTIRPSAPLQDGADMLVLTGANGTGAKSVTWNYRFPAAQDVVYTVSISVHYIGWTSRAQTIPYECSYDNAGTTATILAKRLSQRTGTVQGVSATLKDNADNTLLLKVKAGTTYYVKVSDDAAGVAADTIVADSVTITPVLAEGPPPQDDQPGFRMLGGTWGTIAYGYLSNGHKLDTTGGNLGSAEWLLPDLSTGFYEVSACWRAYTDRFTAVPYTVHHANGSTTVYVDQRSNSDVWVPLCSADFVSGSKYRVVIGQPTGTGPLVIADAIRVAKRPQTMGAKSLIGYLWLGYRASLPGTLAAGTTLPPLDLSSMDTPENVPILVDWVTPNNLAFSTHQNKGGHVLCGDGRVDFVDLKNMKPRWIDGSDDGTWLTFYW